MKQINIKKKNATRFPSWNQCETALLRLGDLRPTLVTMVKLVPGSVTPQWERRASVRARASVSSLKGNKGTGWTGLTAGRGLA